MKLTKKSLFYYIPAIIILIIIIIIIIINKSSTSYEGKIYAAVDSEIIIERDKNGLPFVKAGTMNDAYFAIGFLHGQDRLPLLEYFRAVARARLSELTGNEGTFLDKLSLTIGFARKAENLIPKLKSPYIDYLNSYIKGINASKKEFKGNGALKGISSSDWTLKDAISILLLFEWSESFLNNKKLIFPLPDRLNPRMLKEVIPEELIYQYSDDERNLVNLLMKIRNVVSEWIGPFQQGFAFYISGENMEDGKSASGFTLDGKMSIFPRWYPVTISLSSGNTVNNKIEGVTASGLPFIFFGRNKDISFFGFNLNIETQDFYLERTRVINRIHQYYRNGTWNNFTVVNENLFSDPKQKNKDESILAVRATDIGPVISDLTEKEEDIFCLTINSLSPDETYINALFDLPLAGSMAKAKNLVWNIHSLPRQYLFTSNDDAVCIYSGKMHQRNVRKLFFDSGEFTDGIIDLSGYGKKLTANITMIGNKIFDDAPGIIQDRVVCKDTDRYNTFMALLERDGFLSPKDIAESLNDTRSAIAEKFVSVFIPILEQVLIPSAKLAKIYFSNWNYNMDTESVAATIFNTILIYMIEETVHDEIGNSTHVLMENYTYLIDKFYNLLLPGNSIIFNDVNTKDSVENRDNIFDRAFLKTLKYLNKQRGPEMENWKWGAVHKGHFNMPLARQSFFEKKMDKFEDVGIAGGNSTIKNGEASAVNLLTPTNVSVLSGIFYLDLQLSFFSLPVSQSLDPDSEYFWNYNNSSEFVNADSAEAIHKLVLLPNKK
jgi:penicillin G amidase